MKFPRREFLRIAGAAFAAPAISQIAWALDYPSRPVHLIVKFPAGGTDDIIARLMGQWLSQRLGQAFVVENRAGAAGNIATEMVVRSKPDGYTLLLLSTPNAINAAVYDHMNFNFIRDIAPVARFVRDVGVMVVNPSLPAKTISEFIAYAKANPRKISMASGGTGSLAHVCGELFKMMSGIDMVHVPYRGTPQALSDLLSGQVQVMFDFVPNSIEHIKAGKLRPLGVTTAARLDVLRDVPAIAEFLPGYEASGWQGIGAPRDTPVEVIGRLNMEINAALADPTIKMRLMEIGDVPAPMSVAKFREFIAEETEKWAKVVKFAGIKAE